jgi:hypothetical protein
MFGYRPADSDFEQLLHYESLLRELEAVQRFFYVKFEAGKMYTPHFVMVLSHMRRHNPAFYSSRMITRRIVNLLAEFRDYEANHSGNYFFNRYVLSRPSIIPDFRDDATTILGSSFGE